ncbi:MAG: mercury methylation ferredoxin HgcB [Geobacteraceae bacterium]
MECFRHLDQVTSLRFDADLCIACGMCCEVCPHQVFEATKDTVCVKDRDACMECGACMRNCPVSALCVDAGVGCATGIITTWFRAKIRKNSSDNCCC